MSLRKSHLAVCALIAALPGLAAADVFSMPAGQTSLEMVPVGHPSNAPDTRVASDGTTGYGAVGYDYHIGKFEVTAAQYTQFLNAVAKSDTYGLYSTSMSNPPSGGNYPHIQRTGVSGNYTYTVATEWSNRPVTYVSWGDAARFANWLTNGQPIGEQDPSTTEDGSYYLNGATLSSDLSTVLRKGTAKYVLPTDNEWHKAAYYDPAKPGGTGYWLYATRSDDAPGNELSATEPNNANYMVGDPLTGTYTLGSPYWTTEVGAFGGSSGAFGTFDQSGNVVEWLEPQFHESGPYRRMRGGGYGSSLSSLMATSRLYAFPSVAYGGTGFRIALVPEPATLTLLTLGAGGLLRRRRRPA